MAVGDGEALFRCTPDASTYNPIGMVHGGLLCTLLDSAAGCAVHTRPPAGARYASIEIKVSYLQPVRADQGAIEVLGRALRVGRRVAFAGRTLATRTVRSSVTRRRRSRSVA